MALTSSLLDIITYRKNDRHTPAYSLAAIKHCRLADPQVLPAFAFPARHRGTVEQDFDAVAGGEGGGDFAVLAGDAGLGPGA